MEESRRERIESLGEMGLELRTRLASIKGSATTMLGSPTPLPPDQVRYFLRTIEEQADQIHRLIIYVLTLAESGGESLTVVPGSADVEGLLTEAGATFLRAGSGNSVTVDVPDALPMVSVDRQRILQVLNNLLSSASWYSPADSAIRITAVLDGGDATVSVAYGAGDPIPADGQGLSWDAAPSRNPEVRPEIRQGDPNFAFCKGVVEAHGGRIWVESHGQGQGSRFVFTIPADPEVVPGSPPNSDTQNASTRHPEREQTRILAVAGDEGVLRYLRNALSEAGYAAIESCDPEDMVRVMPAAEPDIILLELTQPGTGEPGAFDLVSGITPAPVILVVGKNLAEEALQAGAADCIFIPFSSDELAARIGSALRRRAESRSEEIPQSYVRGDLTVNYQQRRAYLDGWPIQLTATEYSLLAELSINAGRVLTHDHLLRWVWPSGASPDLRLLRTFVKSLRRKLGDDFKSPKYIFTESRVGYRMAESQ